MEVHLLVLLLLSCSCATSVKVVDHLAVLEISAFVRDADSNPVPEVAVYFVDTGLDQWRSQERSPTRVAHTDATGRMVARYEYLWGYEIPGSSEMANARRFEVVLRKPGFREEVFHFDLNTVERRSDGAFLVPIEAVLRREPSSN